MKSRIGLILAVAGMASLGFPAHADALADFDGIAARCRQAFEERPMTQVAYAEAANAWVKRSYTPAKLSFRVRKTSSPVSPFVAQMEVIEVASAQRGDDEDSARSLEVSPDENVVRSVRRINFAFQDNAWTVIGGTSVTEARRDAGDEFGVVEQAKLSRDAVLESKGPMAVCVGVNGY